MIPEDIRKGTPPEFSVRQTWTGALVLRVRSYETLTYTGEWRDACPRDLPAFFQYMNNGRNK